MGNQYSPDARRGLRGEQPNPEDAAAFSSLGNALLQQGDKNSAEQAFREAIRLLPEVPELRENLRRIP